MHAVAGPDALWLRASAPHEEVDGEILSRFTLSEGESIPFVLTWSPSYGERPVAIDGLQAVDDTERFWLDWAGGIGYDGRFQDAVYRSLLTLKADLRAERRHRRRRHDLAPRDPRRLEELGLPLLLAAR